MIKTKNKNKNKDITDEGGFAGIFSGHNVIDYKGVGDRLDICTLAKGFAYVGMYILECKNNKQVNSIKYTSDNETDFDVLAELEDTTLIFIRRAKPVKLFCQLKNKNCHIAKIEEGMYTINVTQLFRVQIIVTKEISFEKHPWLCALTRNLDEQQAGMLVELEKKSRTNWEYINAEAVMDVVMSANREVFESVIGGNEDMCRAMWELMKPQIDAYVAEKDAMIAEQGEKLVEKDAEIERLKALLAQFSAAGSNI